jgi:hypothetical protein
VRERTPDARDVQVDPLETPNLGHENRANRTPEPVPDGSNTNAENLRSVEITPENDRLQLARIFRRLTDGTLQTEYSDSYNMTRAAIKRRAKLAPTPCVHQRIKKSAHNPDNFDVTWKPVFEPQHVLTNEQGQPVPLLRSFLRREQAGDVPPQVDARTARAQARHGADTDSAAHFAFLANLPALNKLTAPPFVAYFGDIAADCANYFSSSPIEFDPSSNPPTPPRTLLRAPKSNPNAFFNTFLSADKPEVICVFKASILGTGKDPKTYLEAINSIDRVRTAYQS